MSRPIRMAPWIAISFAALLLSSCGSALGNVRLNDLILTATALNGTTISIPGSDTAFLKETSVPEATDAHGTEVSEATDATQDVRTPHGSLTPRATIAGSNNSHEVFGTVQAYMPGSSVTINDVVYTITGQSVVSKCSISTGTAVHLEFGINPDGSFFVHHLGLATGNGDCQGNGQGQNNQGQNGRGEGPQNDGTPKPDRHGNQGTNGG